MDPDGPSTVALTIGTAAWRRYLPHPEAVCRRTVAATLDRVPTPPWLARAEVGVLLADDETVRRLNAEHRGQDRTTNVLSFPTFEHILEEAPSHLPPGPVPLGDVVLALETIRAEAAAEDKLLRNHVTPLLVHGCLPLRGYDHQSAEDAARMEELERAILERLGIADPYADAAERTVSSAATKLLLETES